MLTADVFATLRGDPNVTRLVSHDRDKIQKIDLYRAIAAIEEANAVFEGFYLNDYPGRPDKFLGYPVHYVTAVYEHEVFGGMWSDLQNGKPRHSAAFVILTTSNNKQKCRFCNNYTNIVDGLVDIGGLTLCVSCYQHRSTRTELPCEICQREVPIIPNPLISNVICISCNQKADLRGAWQRAREKQPCDKCGGTEESHHATVYGQNICHKCYQRYGACTQCYPGDRGYSAFPPHKPSVPAVVLATSLVNCDVSCVVCKTGLSDPHSLTLRFGLACICEVCRGLTWWDYMDKHREELVPTQRSSQTETKELVQQKVETWRDRSPLL